MPDNRVVKWLWGPLRKLVSTIPERNLLLVLSLVTGVGCGLAAVLLKLSIGGLHRMG